MTPVTSFFIIKTNRSTNFQIYSGAKLHVSGSYVAHIRWSDQEGWKEQGLYHAWGKSEMHAQVWLENMKGRDQLRTCVYIGDNIKIGTGTSGRLMWLWWSFCSHKRQRISQLTAQLLGRYCCMECHFSCQSEWSWTAHPIILLYTYLYHCKSGQSFKLSLH
jgi:hypothetical protein